MRVALWLCFSVSAVAAGTPMVLLDDSRGGGSEEVASADSMPSPSEIESDRALGERLSSVQGGPAAQIDFLSALAWNSEEPEGLRGAALRRLRTADARSIGDTITRRIVKVPKAEQMGLLTLIVEHYPNLGGRHPSLDYALAEMIRSPLRDVASAAIDSCSLLQIPDAYIPMREVLARADAPSALKEEALEGLGRLGDPRAVLYFEKILNENTLPKDAIYRALSMLGRSAALLLKTRMEQPDPEERRMALEALLPRATAEDLTALYAYVQKNRPEGELKTRIYETIARLEAREHERSLASD